MSIARNNKIAVKIRERSDRYTVIFQDPDGVPHAVKQFHRDDRERAYVYREGFSDGLYQAASLLEAIIGGH